MPMDRAIAGAPCHALKAICSAADCPLGKRVGSVVCIPLLPLELDETSMLTGEAQANLPGGVVVLLQLACRLRGLPVGHLGPCSHVIDDRFAVAAHLEDGSGCRRLGLATTAAAAFAAYGGPLELALEVPQAAAQTLVLCHIGVDWRGGQVTPCTPQLQPFLAGMILI